MLPRHFFRRLSVSPRDLLSVFRVFAAPDA